MGSSEEVAIPLPLARGLEEHCKQHQQIPDEFDFSIFRGIKNHPFLSIIHYLPVILTANFNDFAFTLSMAGFYQFWLKSQRGSKPEQVDVSRSLWPPLL